MKSNIGKWIGLVAASALLTGCISHKSVVYQDVERTRIEFESDAAARFIEICERYVEVVK